MSHLKTNSSKGVSTSSSTVKSRSGNFCCCDGRMVSYQCKKGQNKGRLFWRCPFWRSNETCNLFIWDEDMGEKGENEDESIMKSELEVVGYLKVMYEDSKKKNKNLKNKLKSERFSGNFKMLCFLVSFMFNVYFVMKCNS